MALDLSQYHHRAFHLVRRKGAKISTRVAVPGEALEALDTYIREVRGTEATTRWRRPPRGCLGRSHG